MLFNSLSFLIFFPIVTILYFAIPYRFRWALLLIASCIFYMAFVPIYILILLTTNIIDYYAAIFIEESQGKKRKLFLIVSIISNCLILFVFKYFNFFNANFSYLAGIIGWNYPIKALSLILPIGLSFHVFQSLSYVIEVYYQRQKTERNFGIYSLYVMFFPQLVAGPIERPGNLLKQFYEKHDFDYIRVTNGLKLMAWGFFKKVVIADRLAIYVNTVYNNPYDFQAMSLFLATIFFAFQIYCDFSGYSDIAIGAAQVMGFRLMNNFNRPYFAKSISEFWQRWHISLSTWFKDYVYIPLGGSRVGKSRWFYNLFITFLISGFWHGANWTYIVWGALNGAYLIIEILSAPVREKIFRFARLDKNPVLSQIIQIGTVFILIDISWILFRARNIGESFYIIKKLVFGIVSLPRNIIHCLIQPEKLISLYQPLFLGEKKSELFFSFGLIVFLIIMEKLQGSNGIRAVIAKKPTLVRWAAYYALILSIILLGKFNNSAFIYFQF